LIHDVFIIYRVKLKFSLEIEIILLGINSSIHMLAYKLTDMD